MNVIEMTAPSLLNTWMVADLFRRAFPAGSLITGGFEEVPEKFATMVADPRYRFLIGVEDTELKALACIFLPSGDENVHAQIVQFYNDGSTKLRRHLVDQIVEVLKSAGHDKVWAINQTGAPDSIWARMFRRAGEAKRVGSIMEVALGAKG